MAGWKKGVIIVALIVVILAGITGLITWGVSGDSEPEWHAEERTSREMVLVDENALATVLTKTAGEWDKLGKQGGKYKNPETGQFTMVPAALCAGCNEFIPYPQMGKDDLTGLSGQARTEKLRDIDRIKYEMVCPKCQKANPFNANEPRQ